MRLFKIYILFFLMFVASNALFALTIDMSENEIANGQTVLIEFEKEKNIKYNAVLLDKKKYKIFDNPCNDTKMYALVAVDYDAKPKDTKLQLHYEDKKEQMQQTVMLQIKDGKYEKETLKVDEAKVHLSEKNIKSAEAETQEAMDIYNTVTDASYITTPFIAPMSSKVTSSFGKARIFNDALKSYHSGTDFRAKVGTPIGASNDGVVVLAKDRFYAGGSVIIDHGQGIYTCYFHMSKFNVQKNEKIKKGQIIGLSGESGRVTGPHLHFATRVGGVQVDPMQLMTLLNNTLLNKGKIR